MTSVPTVARLTQVRGPGLETQPGHTLSFLLPLIQVGQLWDSCQLLAKVCAKVLVNHLGRLSLPRKGVGLLFTVDVKQQHNNKICAYRRQWPPLPYKFYVLGQIGLSKQCIPRSDCF